MICARMRDVASRVVVLSVLHAPQRVKGCQPMRQLSRQLTRPQLQLPVKQPISGYPPFHTMYIMHWEVNHQNRWTYLLGQ